MLTYVVEVERILNNRPITKLPDSPDDWTVALAPNSILTGSLAEDVQLGNFLKADAGVDHGKKPSTWLTSFGSNGLISTCLCFSPGRSGLEPLLICSREIWSL